MKAAALRGALSDRAREGRVHVVESFWTVRSRRPRSRWPRSARWRSTRRYSWCCTATTKLSWLSLRNVTEVHLIESGQLNTYDVLVADEVIFTTAALDEFLGIPRRGAPGEGGRDRRLTEPMTWSMTNAQRRRRRG